jgi:hypothetical protein
MRDLVLGALTIILVSYIAPLSADSIHITSLTGNWSSALPAGCCTIQNPSNPSSPRTIRWGQPLTTGGNQSGYTFDPRDAPFVAPTDSAPIDLGEFSHLNFPIYQGATEARLNFFLGFNPAASPTPANISGQFVFHHEETPNSGTCAYYSPPGFECTDRVTVTTPLLDTPFSFGGKNYFFNLLGFSLDGGLSILPGFLTFEGRESRARLFASITSIPVHTPPTNGTPGGPQQPVNVPEPGSFLLLGAGLALAARRLRRRC